MRPAQWNTTSTSLNAMQRSSGFMISAWMYVDTAPFRASYSGSRISRECTVYSPSATRDLTSSVPKYPFPPVTSATFLPSLEGAFWINLYCSVGHTVSGFPVLPGPVQVVREAYEEGQQDDVEEAGEYPADGSVEWLVRVLRADFGPLLGLLGHGAHHLRSPG